MIKNALLLFLFFQSMIFKGFAVGSENGIITGKIIDKSNNELLIGVPVLIEGTTLGTTSDLDGKFTIENVPPGNHNLIFRCVGYTSKIITGIDLKPSQVLNVDVMMEANVQQMKEVTITSEMRRESIGSILLMQKKSANFQDGISSEAIKKTNDKNTSEVIRRISGTSIQEGKFVLIRGLNDRYNNAMLNGIPLSSTEPDRKAFSFDLFPSSLLDNLIIVKTATPELSADFAGGLIQVNTKEIPDRKFLEISIGTGLNSQSTFKEFQHEAGGKKDWIGIDDGTRELPEDFPSADEFKKANQSQKFEYSKLLPNTWKIENGNSAPLAQKYQLATGFNTKIAGREFGLISSLVYNSTQKTIYSERSDYDYDASQNYLYEDKQFKKNILWGGIINSTFKLNNNNKISLKNIYTINSENEVISRNGTDFENIQRIKASAVKFSSSRFLNSILTGDHFLPVSKSKIRWSGSITQLNQNIPDLRRMYYYRNIDPSAEDTTTYFAYIPFGNASPNYGGRFYSQLDEKIYNGEASFQLPLSFLGSEQNLKAGYSEQYRERDFNARVLGYIITNPGLFNYNLLTKPADSLFLPENMGTRGFRIDEITNPSDHYTASSNIHAGYLQFDNKLNSSIRLIWGVRLENFIQKLNSFGYSNDTINVRTNYLDVLPSLNAVYALSENSNLRFAVSKTVARPEFRELAPFGFYDFSTATSVKGNDSLIPSKIRNIDLRYELFPSSGQLVSISLFHKQFKNPIEPVVESSGAGSRTVSFSNAPSAYVYGAELEFRKTLDFLNKILLWNEWDHFTAFGNLSLMKSRVDKSGDLRAKEDRPLQGQSPYIVNAGLGYFEPLSGVSLNVVYNRIGKRIYQVGNSSYLSIEEKPRNILDIQLSKRIIKNGEIKLSAGDVFNESSVFYQDQDKNGKFNPSKDTEISKYRFGINYSISLSYKF